MRDFIIVSLLSLMFGAGIAILFANAVGEQAIVQQEGE
jgi:hypothetical protein